MQRRYAIHYIPASDVEAFCVKHKKEIDAGASVWDLQPSEYFQKTLTVTTAAEWREMCEKLLPLDECGELHIDRDEYSERYGCWITIATNVYGEHGLTGWVRNDADEAA